MKKRILSALLLGAMVISLAACGGDGDAKDTTDSGQTTEAPETDPAGIAPDDYQLPFAIYAPAWDMYNTYFFADDAGTDVMTKALYDRELAVEDHLGVDISYTVKGTINDVPPLMQQLVMTGDDDYQLVLTHCFGGVQKMLTENLLYDFYDFEHVNLEADWWNQQAVEALEVNGHLFYGVSDYMLSNPNCLLVNLEMIEELDLEDPYQLVRDGDWTVDKMKEMMSKVTKDNGDGKWDYMDTYGFTSTISWFGNSFTFSSGVDFVARDDDGGYKFVFNSERTFDMVEKISELLTGSDTYLYGTMYNLSMAERIASDEYVDIATGRALFNTYNVAWLSEYRDLGLDFGVLPYPKLDALQDGYYTNDWSGLMCVPRTVDNEEMVGKVIELLSFYSKDVRYAYYEVLLGEKFTRDPASKEMLDIIFDGVTFNAGVSYFGEGAMNELFYWPNDVMSGGSAAGSFSSFLATYQPKAEAEIEAFNQTVASLNFGD